MVCILTVAFIFLPNKSQRSGNIFMWVALFIGNGMLMCLYSMEWYARQRCPSTAVGISNCSVTSNNTQLDCLYIPHTNIWYDMIGTLYYGVPCMINLSESVTVLGWCNVVYCCVILLVSMCNAVCSSIIIIIVKVVVHPDGFVAKSSDAALWY